MADKIMDFIDFLRTPAPRRTPRPRWWGLTPVALFTLLKLAFEGQVNVCLGLLLVGGILTKWPMQSWSYGLPKQAGLLLWGWWLLASPYLMRPITPIEEEVEQGYVLRLILPPETYGGWWLFLACVLGGIVVFILA